jgi:spore germination protein GerM
MRRATAVVLIALLATGCGVPTQDAPVRVAPDAVPSELHSTRPETSAPTTPDPRTMTLRVHFIRKERLVALPREARAASTPDRLREAIAELETGPSEAEQEKGLTSALPPGLELTVVEVEGRQAVLELGGETEGQSATENVLAVGQIVLTVTSLPAIDQVRFTRDGTSVEALLADGALTTEPLTAADYAVLRTT